MKKLIVVTGGTKGIGKALILKFAQHNFDVVTCARNKQDLEELEREFKEKFSDNQIHTLVSDLSIKEKVDEFSNFVLAQNKPIDVLINNTGVFFPGKVTEEEEGVLEKMIETNLYSAYHLTRKLVKNIIETKNASIFNICSTASIKPYINGGSYCISKYALLGFTKVLREELKPFNTRVTAVLPGATLTASWEGAPYPEERFIPASDIAEAIFSAYQLSPQTVIEELLIRPMLGDIE